MKVINVKKLIASTLIFLFSNYTAPVLADVPNHIPQAHVGVPQLLRGEKSYLVYRCKVDLEPLSTSFRYHKSVLSFTTDSFHKSPVAYGWKGQSLDKSLTQLLQHPRVLQKVAGIDPIIIGSSDGLSQLILLSGWNASASNRSFLFLSALFSSAFAAFSGCKMLAAKNTPVWIHTQGWITKMPFISCFIQLLAAHLSRVDGLIVSEEEKQHWLNVEAHLQKLDGQSMKQILAGIFN